MSCEEKFNAAVNVIRSLPKNGAYQPSHELMLRFYGYYKQATEGPNNMPKPNFWEVIKKAKWDAWSKLGNMSKEEAMLNYVEELKKIVETMAYTDNVANFLTSLDSFYESVPAEDLEMLIGPVIEKVRSQPGSPLSRSPLASREASPHRLTRNQKGATSSKHVNITSSLETSPTSSYSASPLPPDTDDEDEAFLDTVEQAEPQKTSELQGACAVTNRKKVQNTSNSDTGAQSLTNGNNIHHGNPAPRGRNREKVSPPMKKKECGDVEDGGIDVSKLVERFSEVLDPVNEAILSMRSDIEALKLRMSTHNSSRQMKVSGYRRSPRWLPFQDISIPTAVFIIVWPLLATLALQYIRSKQQSHH